MYCTPRRRRIRPQVLHVSCHWPRASLPSRTGKADRLFVSLGSEPQKAEAICLHFMRMFNRKAAVAIQGLVLLGIKYSDSGADLCRRFPLRAAVGILALEEDLEPFAVSCTHVETPARHCRVQDDLRYLSDEAPVSTVLETPPRAVPLVVDVVGIGLVWPWTVGVRWECLGVAEIRAWISASRGRLAHGGWSRRTVQSKF